MKKQLSEMTLKELWKLFPIILKKHNPQYINWYEDEKQSILDAVKPEYVIRINHIGSSAVEGLISKPTIDILLEIDGFSDVTKLSTTLKKIGWGLMQQESNPFKMKYNKGYTPEGYAERVFHLHVGYFGDWNELYFRDYLIAHPDIAMEYGKLKMELREKFGLDRDGYTKAKTDFVIKYSIISKQEYRDRYKPQFK